MTSLRFRAAIIPAMAALILTGCKVGPVYHAPAATTQPPPATYKESPVPSQTSSSEASGTWQPAQPQDAMLRGKWWEIYNQPELNDLEDKLNIDNQNIKVYFENFMEARTLIAQARSQLYPTLGTSPAYTRSRASGNLGNTANGNITGGQQSSITSLPLSASWEPDLWGKVRSLIHEQQFNAQLSAADLENERLTEQATLAVIYFEIRGQDALAALYQETVKADQKAYDIAKSGYDAGVTDQITVVEAQNTLQNAQSALTNLGVARAQYEHAIAMLIGANASGFSMPVKPLTLTPPPIPIGVPSQLLERRPDIAASERNMASANSQIGVAVAAFYPNLTLSAQGGLESSSISHLLDWPSRFWSVGPSVSETIFDAGLRRATVNQYVAVYNADVASYRQTVLAAFQQVEDYLSEVRILSQQMQQQQAAVDSAKKFLELETSRYDTGIDPYVDVVTAQNTLLSDQQSLTSLHTQQMTASVQLIEALGGGWDRSQLPSTTDVSKKLGKLAIEK
ncbi:MAG TPA: efflux transporter outer membrane subunit [Acidobacteriaceae bacterium]|jgi:NodT family efflux transporter outer membrane factor (OMF) lipoprotein|nr:efflux transporter outer membrane subunit [Acidobacteriaceae bacterium]